MMPLGRRLDLGGYPELIADVKRLALGWTCLIWFDFRELSGWIVDYTAFWERQVEYNKVEDYIRAVADNPSLALMPIPMAAEFFGISRQGIAARVRSGSLRGIKISGVRYITLESVVSSLKKHDDEVEAVRRFLEDRVRQGVSSVEYAPVMGLLGLSPALSADRMKIGRILGSVSRQTFNEGKGLLSVIVHKKNSRMPSENGFFSLVESLIQEGAIGDWRAKYNSPEDFVVHETRRVLKAFRKSNVD
jgi:hypothetical protein